MATKGSLTLDQLRLLCDYSNNIYVSKRGQDYIDALSRAFSLNNLNDKPFTSRDIVLQPTLNQFRFDGKNDFSYICMLRADPMEIIDDSRKNEKIVAFDFVSATARDIFNKSLGVAYMITCVINGNEHIIKFGQSRTTFKARLGSYNCGVVNNWRTASTTNIKMLQSMVTTRQSFKLYLFDCSQDLYRLTWHGITSVPFATPKSLAVEDIMVNEFIKQFGKKPLANVQANATTVD